MVFRVFFDANVLVPITVTDLLLRCANKGFYTPYWSEEVLQEVGTALERLNPPLASTAIEKRLNTMRIAFPDACTDTWEHLLRAFSDLPDHDDAHVCAAALASKADVIVTFNLKDFPEDILSRHKLFAQHPDEFMLDLWDLKPQVPQEISGVIDQMAAVKGTTWREIANRLHKNNLPHFAKKITEWHFDNSTT